MPIGEFQNSRDFVAPEVTGGRSILRFVRPFVSAEETFRTAVNSLAPSMLVGSGASVVGLTLGFAPEHIGVLPASHATGFGVSRLAAGTTTETITPSAEKFAKALGFYGALVLTRQIVREKLGPAVTALYVDRKEDPDDDEHETICFSVTLRESVDRALELDDSLQNELIEHIPPRDRIHMSFSYQFE